MVQAGLTNHVTLRDVSDANKVGLTLARDQEGKLLYQWDLAPVLAPDVLPKDVQYGEFTQDLELTWGQDDWSGGGLAFYFDPRQPNKYALAEGVWPDSTNELATGFAAYHVSFGIQNGSGQVGSTANWARVGPTQLFHFVRTNAAVPQPHSGETAFEMNGVDTGDYAGTTAAASGSTDQPGSRFQSQTITVFAKARLNTGSGATLRIQILETGGASTPTTDGSGVSLTTTYQSLSASVTVQSDTTNIEIRVEMSADGGSSRTVLFGDVQLLVGSTIPNASHIRMLVMGTNLIAITDRAVWKYIEKDTDDSGLAHYWALQKVHAQVITGAQIFDNRLLIGQGESTAYQYSDVDDPTVWTASNLSGDSSKANRFVKTLNVNGNWVLAKTLNDDEVYLAVDPLNGGAWGSAIEVGKDDHTIINVYNIGGTMAVGKEDGVYIYRSLQGNRFENVFADAEHMASTDNFNRGIVYQGRFYTKFGETGFARWNGAFWEPLDHIIASPSFPEISNSIRAFGTDGNWLYILVEEPVADSLTKTSWILATKEFQSGWVTHTLLQTVLSDAIDMQVFKPAGQAENNRYLYINGDLNAEASTYRIRLPDRSSIPRRSVNPLHPVRSSLTTSYMDWNRPNVPKAFKQLTLISEDLAAATAIVAAYQVDNETSFTNINASDSTFETSPTQTITFNSNLTGNRIRLRLTFDGTISTTGVLKSFFLEASWRPTRKKRWVITGKIEDNIRGLMGATEPLRAQVLLSRLDTLRKATAPLKFGDIDGAETNVNITQMREIQLEEAMQEAGQGGARYSRAVQLELTEN